jgi:hypothetical protein
MDAFQGSHGKEFMFPLSSSATHPFKWMGGEGGEGRGIEAGPEPCKQAEGNRVNAHVIFLLPVTERTDHYGDWKAKVVSPLAYSGLTPQSSFLPLPVSVAYSGTVPIALLCSSAESLTFSINMIGKHCLELEQLGFPFRFLQSFDIYGRPQPE